MRILRWSLILLMVSMAIAAAAAQGPASGGAPAAGQRGGGAAPMAAMTLTTTAFTDGGQIPAKYTQAGDQTSPSLTWTNAPPNTVSFLLHMHDLEGVRNRTTDDQLHWLVWNIPPSVTALPEGVPQGPEMANGSRQTSASGPVYRGPGAPASGPMHHYTFEVFALDTKVDVPAGGDPFETRTSALKAIQGHVLGKAVLMGLFHRPQ